MSDSLALQLRAGTPGEVRAGMSDLDGRTVILIRADNPERKGALTPDDGDTMVRAMEMALDKRLPLVILLASSGADANHGVAALDGWGRAARALSRCSGVVPVLAGVTGPAVSGSALLIGLADIVVMASDSYAFVSGPIPVRAMTGVTVGLDELGGADVHHRSTGAAHAVVASEEVLPTLSDILRFLPSNNGLLPPTVPSADPADRPTPEAGDLLPATPTGSYDVRDVIRAVADDDDFLELRAGWAPNLVTGLASLGGRPVGLVANQPIAIAGTLDIPASQKGGRFVAFCDAFNLPIITLVDTPGFYPGKDLEWRGMIRHGAQLAFAYARATVPRVAVVLRKSYGGAYIVMDSKTMGNDAYLAWPTAELAVMGATQAAQILRRGASDEEIEQYVEEYDATYLNPYVAAERGFVDSVIDPASTRRELVDLIELFSTKREVLPERRHDNTPL
ncbi:MAG: carboxyl transferase domain-containing protein [Actinomycetota bacterium]|nr:carboxyl transferase domain-containing protein [Actinomycetota bacterium]